jgi:hypothetical protein
MEKRALDSSAEHEPKRQRQEETPSQKRRLDEAQIRKQADDAFHSLIARDMVASSLPRLYLWRIIVGFVFLLTWFQLREGDTIVLKKLEKKEKQEKIETLEKSAPRRMVKFTCVVTAGKL